MESDGYRWSTCSKQPRLVDCRIGVVNKLDRRRRRWVVDNAIDLPWRNFLRPDLGQSSREKCPSFFSRNPNFLITQYGIGRRKPACQIDARFVQSFRYNTGLWQTDRRTDTRRQHIPPWHIASRGEKAFWAHRYLNVLVQNVHWLQSLGLHSVTGSTCCRSVQFSPFYVLWTRLLFHHRLTTAAVCILDPRHVVVAVQCNPRRFIIGVFSQSAATRQNYTLRTTLIHL